MDRKDLFNALNFVVEGFLHACGDTQENIKIAREELQQTCDDWLDTQNDWSALKLCTPNEVQARAYRATLDIQELKAALLRDAPFDETVKLARALVESATRVHETQK